ncbi:hypothetical protein WA158_008271 [Blastocystis sp. Blastoise]
MQSAIHFSNNGEVPESKLQVDLKIRDKSGSTNLASSSAPSPSDENSLQINEKRIKSVEDEKNEKQKNYDENGDPRSKLVFSGFEIPQNSEFSRDSTTTKIDPQNKQDYSLNTKELIDLSLTGSTTTTTNNSSNWVLSESDTLYVDTTSSAKKRIMSPISTQYKSIRKRVDTPLNPPLDSSLQVNSEPLKPSTENTSEKKDESWSSTGWSSDAFAKSWSTNVNIWIDYDDPKQNVKSTQKSTTNLGLPTQNTTLNQQNDVPMVISVATNTLNENSTTIISSNALSTPENVSSTKESLLNNSTNESTNLSIISTHENIPTVNITQSNSTVLNTSESTNLMNSSNAIDSSAFVDSTNSIYSSASMVSSNALDSSAPMDSSFSMDSSDSINSPDAINSPESSDSPPTPTLSQLLHNRIFPNDTNPPSWARNPTLELSPSLSTSSNTTIIDTATITNNTPIGNEIIHPSIQTTSLLSSEDEPISINLNNTEQEDQDIYTNSDSNIEIPILTPNDIIDENEIPTNETILNTIENNEFILSFPTNIYTITSPPKDFPTKFNWLFPAKPEFLIGYNTIKKHKNGKKWNNIESLKEFINHFTLMFIYEKRKNRPRIQKRITRQKAFSMLFPQSSVNTLFYLLRTLRNIYSNKHRNSSAPINEVAKQNEIPIQERITPSDTTNNYIQNEIEDNTHTNMGTFLSPVPSDSITTIEPTIPSISNSIINSNSIPIHISSSSTNTTNNIDTPIIMNTTINPDDHTIIESSISIESPITVNISSTIESPISIESPSNIDSTNLSSSMNIDQINTNIINNTIISSPSINNTQLSPNSSIENIDMELDIDINSIPSTLNTIDSNTNNINQQKESIHKDLVNNTMNITTNKEITTSITNEEENTQNKRNTINLDETNTQMNNTTTIQNRNEYYDVSSDESIINISSTSTSTTTSPMNSPIPLENHISLSNIDFNFTPLNSTQKDINGSKKTTTETTTTIETTTTPLPINTNEILNNNNTIDIDIDIDQNMSNSETNTPMNTMEIQEEIASTTMNTNNDTMMDIESSNTQENTSTNNSTQKNKKNSTQKGNRNKNTKNKSKYDDYIKAPRIPNTEDLLSTYSPINIQKTIQFSKTIKVDNTPKRRLSSMAIHKLGNWKSFIRFNKFIEDKLIPLVTPFPNSSDESNTIQMNNEMINSFNNICDYIQNELYNWIYNNSTPTYRSWRNNNLNNNSSIKKYNTIYRKNNSYSPSQRNNYNDKNSSNKYSYAGKNRNSNSYRSNNQYRNLKKTYTRKNNQYRKKYMDMHDISQNNRGYGQNQNYTGSSPNNLQNTTNNTDAMNTHDISQNNHGNTQNRYDTQNIPGNNHDYNQHRYNRRKNNYNHPINNYSNKNKYKKNKKYKNYMDLSPSTTTTTNRSTTINGTTPSTDTTSPSTASPPTTSPPPTTTTPTNNTNTIHMNNNFKQTNDDFFDNNPFRKSTDNEIEALKKYYNNLKSNLDTLKYDLNHTILPNIPETESYTISSTLSESILNWKNKLQSITLFDEDEELKINILNILQKDNENNNTPLLTLEQWKEILNLIMNEIESCLWNINQLKEAKIRITSINDAKKIQSEFDKNTKAFLRSKVFSKTTPRYCEIPSKDLQEQFTKLYDSQETSDNILLPDIIKSNTKQLLNPPALNKITYERIRHALKFLPNNSTPGPNGLPYEVYKYSSSACSLLAYILEICRSNGITLKSWSSSITCLLDKNKSDPSSLGNWRPLALQNTESKILSSIMVTYMNELNNKQNFMSKYQKGFISGIPGCEELNFILQNYIANFKLSRRAKTAAYFTFLDLEKAYDTVPQRLMHQILQYMNFPIDFRNIILSLYSSANTVIRLTKNSYTDPIYLKRGIRQGDPLSPLLFNIILNPLLNYLNNNQAMMMNIKDNTTPNNPIVISESNAYAYADDIVLLANNKEDTEVLLGKVKEILNIYHMKLSVNKCKCLAMKYSNDGNRKLTYTPPPPTYNNEVITLLKDTEIQRYLGCPMGESITKRREFWVNTLDEIKEKINSLNTIPISPHQKLITLRQYIIPCIEFLARNGDTNILKIKELDVLIRNNVKNWNGCSSVWPKDFYSTSIRDGGLGVTSLLDRYYIGKASLLVRMANSNDINIRNTLYYALRYTTLQNSLYVINDPINYMRGHIPTEIPETRKKDLVFFNLSINNINKPLKAKKENNTIIPLDIDFTTLNHPFPYIRKAIDAIVALNMDICYYENNPKNGAGIRIRSTDNSISKFIEAKDVKRKMCKLLNESLKIRHASMLKEYSYLQYTKYLNNNISCNKWIYKTKHINPSKYCALLNLRMRTLYTGEMAYRRQDPKGKKPTLHDTVALCPYCLKTKNESRIHSQTHIMTTCARISRNENGHDLISKRHNEIRECLTRSLAKALPYTIYKVNQEKSMNTILYDGKNKEEWANRRPDIIITSEKEIRMVEIGVTYEQVDGTRDTILEMKHTKDHSYDEAIQKLQHDFPNKQISYYTVILGASGTIPESTIHNISQVSKLKGRYLYFLISKINDIVLEWAYKYWRLSLSDSRLITKNISRLHSSAAHIELTQRNIE